MNKLEKLADRLQASIDFATEHNEDFEASSWNYQEGVLLNHNEAKLVVELVKNLAIHDVVKPLKAMEEATVINYCNEIKELFELPSHSNNAWKKAIIENAIVKLQEVLENF